MENRKNKKKEKKSVAKRFSQMVMCGPITIWSLLFIYTPILLLLFMSFMTKGPLGTIKYEFTLDNYKAILDPVYFTVVKESVIVAFLTTVLSILMGYPFAYFMATKKPKVSGVLMLLMMIPFWTNELVIVYSFVILLNNSGIINTLLQHFGIIGEPLDMLYNNFAIIVGMIYMLMPFAVLPMYSSIEKLDKGLIEASKDLGAGPVKTFFKVTLPLTSSGIFAGVILVFIPTIGYYQITDMLGGGTQMMIGNLVNNQFSISRNWPFGAALSMVLAVVILIMLVIYQKMGGDLDDLAA
ncbi:MAG: ABC transporter permease [Wujia sp.]